VPEPLFTARFFLMCAFSFTVFMAAFQLLPTAPFHILALGGTGIEAGLFLGFLTYASAVSAPITGAVADRLGKRRILLVASLAITGFSLLYAVAPTYHLVLALVLVHGVFWSGLLSASAAYVTDIVPASRRAEGLGYAGFASILAVSVAPTIGLWVFDRGGWTLLCLESAALNVAMAAIAWRLPADTPRARGPLSLWPSDLVEWRVLTGAVTLFLYSFSYGGITSFVAVYATELGVTPRALYFTVFALTIIVTRPFLGRYADRVGHVRLIVPCLIAIVAGVWLLTIVTTRLGFVASGVLFGLGFGSAYPIFVAHLMHHVAEHRRGATFGALIGAFDTGIGTGSIAVGWLSEHYGFRAAFGAAGALAVLSIPYFLWMERRQWTRSISSRPTT
jgi:MFS family permease